MRWLGFLMGWVGCVDYGLVTVQEPPRVGPVEASEAITTLGTEFFVGYLANLDLASNGPPDFAIVVHAPEGSRGQVEAPHLGMVVPFEVLPGTTQEIRLPPGVYYGDQSEVVGDTGLIVSSDRPISVHAVHYRLFFSDGTLVLPTPELSTRYRVAAVPDDMAFGPSEFVVVATEDFTIVDVTPSVLTLGQKRRGEPFSILLHRGQTYQVQSVGDLSGTLIEASSPVAVFGGGRESVVECSASSHSWDQLLPVDRWGRDHVVIPHHLNTDRVVVVADADDTEVTVDCLASRMLNQGEVVWMEVDSPTRITSSRPVLVAQVNRGAICTGEFIGDSNLESVLPSALVAPSVAARAVVHRSLFNEVDVGGMVHRVAVVADAAETSVLIDGEERIGDFEPVLADPSRLWANVEVQAGDHRVSSTLGVRARGTNFKSFDAVTWAMGYDCVDCRQELGSDPICP